MHGDVNNIVIMGRLGADPAYKGFEEESETCRAIFDICNAPFGKKGPRYWFTVFCKDAQAEIVHDSLNLRKGDAVRLIAMVGVTNDKDPEGRPQKRPCLYPSQIFIVAKARRGAVRPKSTLGSKPDPVFSDS